MVKRHAQVSFSPSPATKDVEIEEFLRRADELEDEAYADKLFSEPDEFELNVEDLGTMVDQTSTPDAPGSGDMSPIAMHMTESPVPTVEGTEGTPLAPVEDLHAMETVNQDELELFDFWDDENIEPSSPREVDEKEIIDFIHQHGTAQGGNWGQMIMEAIKDGLPEVYEKLEDNRSYSFPELWDIVKEGLAEQEKTEYNEVDQQSLSFFDEIADDSLGPQSKPMAQATDDELLGEFEKLADEETMANKFQPKFDYNEANYDEAGQPLQQNQTQPTPGVTNMTGGSAGSQGSQPGVQPAGGAQGPSGIADRTPGGTTGTTPSSAPMSQGYGQPRQVSQEELSIDNLTEDEEDILPPEDEMLVSEFDSLI